MVAKDKLTNLCDLFFYFSLMKYNNMELGKLVTLMYQI